MAMTQEMKNLMEKVPGNLKIDIKTEIEDFIGDKDESHISTAFMMFLNFTDNYILGEAPRSFAEAFGELLQEVFGKDRFDVNVFLEALTQLAEMRIDVGLATVWSESILNAADVELVDFIARIQSMLDNGLITRERAARVLKKAELLIVQHIRDRYKERVLDFFGAYPDLSGLDSSSDSSDEEAVS